MITTTPVMIKVCISLHFNPAANPAGYPIALLIYFGHVRQFNCLPPQSVARIAKEFNHPIFHKAVAVDAAVFLPVKANRTSYGWLLGVAIERPAIGRMRYTMNVLTGRAEYCHRLLAVAVWMYCYFWHRLYIYIGRSVKEIPGIMFRQQLPPIIAEPVFKMGVVMESFRKLPSPCHTMLFHDLHDL